MGRPEIPTHQALERIRVAVSETPFENDLYLVGGAIRDDLLGIPHEADFDLVTTGDSQALAQLLAPLSSIEPVTYPRFGTAMLRVNGADVELVTARRESYAEESRKPNVEPATLQEDGFRRDFTVNTLMRSVTTHQLFDPTGMGLVDLQNKILRTPLDPKATFYDDPLRMMRAVRFRRRLGFRPAEGLYESIQESRERLRIVSMERVRDELVKMLADDSAPDSMNDLMDLGLFEIFAPEFLPMRNCEQGKYHHLDVWFHTLLVLKNVGSDDLILSLAALLHDIGKPSTRMIDENGNTRFFGHERVGAQMTREILRRLRFPQRIIEQVSLLVSNHMRLGSAKIFSTVAARRLFRDLDGETDRLLQLVEADMNGLKQGVKTMNLSDIREKLDHVRSAVGPVARLESPLSGDQIMAITGLSAGPEVGRIKNLLAEKVLEGQLMPGDQDLATQILKDMMEEG